MKSQKQWIRVWIVMKNILEETVFSSKIMIKNDKEDTIEVVIKIFQNKMQQKVSANDIDRSH